jgi:putative spermidine/putrescine transport system ATP-binding protein
MSFVRLENLAKAFRNLPAYESIDLAVDRGQICVLVGPSGCGKTTLLRSIAGLLSPDRGRILIDGRDVTALPAKDRGIGMVFQHYALFPNMNVRQNLEFGLRQHKVPAAERRRRVDAMIDLMGLSARAQARPAALSGGQKQRVALARALVLEPKLLLLDEPMSALDAQIRKRLREELKRLQTEIGFTAMLVTHDQDDALILGDQIAVMRAGKLEQVGTPLDVYHRPVNRSVASFIGDINVLEPAAIEAAFGLRTRQAWAIHPEGIAILPAGASGRSENHRAMATVKAGRILGPLIHYTLDVKGVRLHACALNDPASMPLLPGQTVEISVAPEWAHKLLD